MGSPDSRYISNQDYGRRLYADNATYAEQMGVGSRKAAMLQNDALYRQSEFKKPYKEDDYEEMEYLADPYPGFPWDWDFDTPFEPGDNFTDYGDIPQDTGGLAIWPCYMPYLCYTDEKTCRTIRCQNTIIQIFNLKAPPGCNITLIKGELCVDCPEAEEGIIEFDVLLRDYIKQNDTPISVYGKRHIVIERCPRPEGICTQCVLAYDYTNSAETIARSGNATVLFTCEGIGENDYYTWSVSGTGFWLDSDHSVTDMIIQGLSAVVYADETACGSCDITVNCLSNVATGSVRCTTGQWSAPTQVCLAETLYTQTGNCCNVVEGKFRYTTCIAIYEDTEQCVACSPYSCANPPGYCGSEFTVDGWKRRSWGDNKTEEWECS